MCGRFTQLFTYAELHEFWRSFTDPLPALATNMQPRWHLCPTDPIWTITHSERDGTKLEHVRWGLAPFWWKNPLKKLPATFNARAETVAEKPMFREAFKTRRAVIPASGWYEWQDLPDGKQPWYFTPANEPVALIAALWETWKNPENKEEVVRSSTMVFPEPNQFVAQYHDRMPVVLDRTNAVDWLTGAKASDEPTLIDPVLV